MKINKLRLIDKNSYLIANSKDYNTVDEFLDEIAQQLENGVQIIELRDETFTRNIIEIGKKIRELCSIYNALFIVYDRLDIAQIIHADGILLDKKSIDIHSVRKYIESNIIVGYNVQTKEEIEDIKNTNVDYVICPESLKNEVTTKCFCINENVITTNKK